MGVSLSYRSTAPVTLQASNRIREEANRLLFSHDWWCEPIYFFEPTSAGKPEYIEGNTKLFLPGYTDNQYQYIEVDPVEGDVMSRRDARFILDRLCAWSHEHKIGWTLEMAGIDLGTILGGAISDRTVHTLQRELGWNILAPIDDGRAVEISTKYASRNG